MKLLKSLFSRIWSKVRIRTKSEAIFAAALILIPLFWVTGVIAPWLLFGPEGFWQILVLAIVDVIWAKISFIVGLVVLVFIANVT